MKLIQLHNSEKWVNTINLSSCLSLKSHRDGVPCDLEEQIKPIERVQKVPANEVMWPVSAQIIRLPSSPLSQFSCFNFKLGLFYKELRIK